MKWGISPSREMPHFFVYFSTRTVMVCLHIFSISSAISRVVIPLEYIMMIVSSSVGVGLKQGILKQPQPIAWRFDGEVAQR